MWSVVRAKVFRIRMNIYKWENIRKMCEYKCVRTSVSVLNCNRKNKQLTRDLIGKWVYAGNVILMCWKYGKWKQFWSRMGGVDKAEWARNEFVPKTFNFAPKKSCHLLTRRRYLVFLLLFGRFIADSINCRNRDFLARFWFTQNSHIWRAWLQLRPFHCVTCMRYRIGA